MDEKLDYSTASSAQIEISLCARLERIRLAQNLTQAALAAEAGVSVITIRRMENGQGVTLDTFIRVLTALKLQANLQTLLPDPSIRPVERTRPARRERQRARPMEQPKEAPSAWTWGDEKDQSA